MKLYEKLARLAADLERISNGLGPTAEELSQAPLLLDWETIHVTNLALTGSVLNHPKLAAGRITTSHIYAASPDWSWVRTLSRFYVLR